MTVPAAFAHAVSRTAPAAAKSRGALAMLRGLGLAASSLLLLPAIGHADSWQFPPKETREEHRFGDLRIIEIVDARKNQHFPDFTVEVWRKKELLAKYPGAGFETLVAAPDHSLFVGLSNRGLPGTAVMILRANGALVVEAKHDIAAFAYCDESVTLVRNWYDDENPAVEFLKDEATGEYTGIRLRACDGGQLNLVEAVVQAYRRTAEREDERNARKASGDEP